VWPRLLRPEAPVPIVYLDLNHWIGLAKADVGHPDGRRNQEALVALREFRAVGQVHLPLSATHFMEMARIKSSRQRHDVARVMEELSGFDCLMNRVVVIKLELEAAFDRLLGEVGQVFDPIPLIGNGGMQVMGMRGGFRIRDQAGADITEEVKARWPGGPDAFDVWGSEVERNLNWSFLAGPADGPEEEELRNKYGWRPEKATAVSHRRAEQEQEQATRLNEETRWRRGRLRDVVSGRYLALEVYSMLEEEAQRRGVDFPLLLPEPDDARRFTDSMPSADVWITLLTARHRNPETRWTANDIYDADALSVAVPYCDLVATEKHATSLLSGEGLPERVGTEVVTNLDELVEKIPMWSPATDPRST
jgi:hypothetical protein